MANEGSVYSRGTLPFPAAPTMTLYSPSTTAYVKVTSSADAMLTTVAPTVTTEALQYASIITHKIADSTTLAATKPAVTEANDYALSVELADDLGAHVVSTAYHVAADAALVTTNASDEATLVAEVNLIRLKLLSHLASTTVHGGLADAINLATVAATSACTDAATAHALLNAIYPAHIAHLLVTDLATYMTHGAAWMPLHWHSAGSFFCKSNVSGHTFATAEYK